MLFEEFFKKKKISLDALQQGDPGLFSEFESHYEQMGEKSFDHTKKFWFNKLRHHYPLPPEVKAEKLRAENQMAEQTVADTLTEPSPRIEAPKLGFTPKFKTQGTPPTPPVADTPQTVPIAADEAPKEPAAKPAAYKPKFQAKNIPAKPADSTDQSKPEEKTEASSSTPVGEQPEPTAKMGFKPRFKAGVTTSKPAEAKEEQPEVNKEIKQPPATEDAPKTEFAPPAKLGFKPRFKAGATTVKPSSEETPATVSEKKDTEQAEPTSEIEAPAEAAAPKFGFKPRFKAGTTTVKSTESSEQPEQLAAAQPEEATVNEPESSAESRPASSPKLGFKSRFKAGVTTTKPTEAQPEETPAEPEIQANNENPEAPAEKPESPAEATPPKPVYKPRFNPNMIKREPPKEE